MFSRTTFPFAIRSKNKKMRKKGRNSLITATTNHYAKLRVEFHSAGGPGPVCENSTQFAKNKIFPPQLKMQERNVTNKGNIECRIAELHSGPEDKRNA